MALLFVALAANICGIFCGIWIQERRGLGLW